MDKILISHYANTYSKTAKDTPFTDFIAGIRDGQWQDHVLLVRTAKTEEEKKKLKIKSPLFRVSGSFSGQKDSDLRKHSGFIAIDLDGIENPNTVKKQIANDPYVYSAFISISGKGLCLLFRIDGSRHADAFDGLSKYLYETYQLISDPSCRNVSRARYISYDPHLLINEDAQVFKKYPPKPKTKKQPPKVVFVNTDFDQIVKSIYDRGLNICEDYGDWLRVCYAIVSEYGDSQTGRDHFDTLSRHSSKYNQKDCEKQYSACLKNHNSNRQKQSTINYIYWLAKQNGIETYSVETKDVIRAAASQHKNGVSKSDIAKGLQKFNQIAPEFSEPIIDQVIAHDIEHDSENIIEDIIHFLQPYELKKNLVTRNVELNGKAIDDTEINTLFIDCKSMFDKATKDLVCSVIFSNKIEQYNPLKSFFESVPKRNHNNTPNLDKLVNCIKTDTENHGKWITKWLVSCVASAYGNYSPLVLVLSGERQGTGKTHFFRYLLPKELRYFFGESKMDNGKDDEILMTKKLIILDDEYGGKSKREEKKLKEITAKEFINVREPYGRVSVDLRRLAVFAGTSNDTQIISDPTGNRRILPIHVLDIDQEMYNDCDKTELWHELYALYQSGYDYTILREDIKQLNESTDMFNASTPEEELLSVKLKPASSEFAGEWMTVTEIIKHLTIDTKYVFSNVRMGLILNKFGYNKKRMKKNGSVITAYHVEKISDYNSESLENTSEPPF
jgi:hypothetical protein